MHDPTLPLLQTAPPGVGDTPPEQAPPAPEQAPPEQAPPAPEPPAPEPAAETAPPQVATVPDFGWDTARGTLIQGVPLVTLDNPHGGYGLGLLVGLDLEASHEAGQKRTISGTFPPEYEPIVGSGGAAYYVDLLTGKGWTVALNPEGD